MDLVVVIILFICTLATCVILISIISDTHSFTQPTQHEPEGKKSNTYVQGAIGEWIVAKELSNLPKEFAILTDYQIPNFGNIDLIVVGRTGIFIIDAKSHLGGTVDYDGNSLTRNGYFFEKDFLKKISNQKTTIYHRLNEKLGRNYYNSIQCVIVFTDPRMLIPFDWEQKRNSFVIGLDRLSELIKTKPVADLNQNQIHDIIDALSEYAPINRRAYLGISIINKT